jgi:hypothetical protein
MPASKPQDWQMQPPLRPEDAPVNLDQSPRFFRHNLEFVDKLVKKDVVSGLADGTFDIPKMTAEQIVNLLHRSKLRRRKQIRDESIGKVGVR